MTPIESPSPDPELAEQLARLKSFLKRAVRFWPATLLTVALGALAFGVFSHFRQLTYRSETVILYVERRSAGDEARGENQQQAVNVRLKELLFARPNMERVIKKFGLYPDVLERYGMGDAIEELKKHIEFRAPGGDTFSIAFVGHSPTEAQAVTADLARQVIDGDSDLRKNQARLALDFLQGERKSREAALGQAEEALASFMAQHPRFALDATPLANGAAIRASMGAAPGAAPPRQTWLAPRVSAPKPGSPAAPAGAPMPAVSSSAEEGRARAALAAANEDLTEKMARYTPAHPDVKAAEAAVQRANERLTATVAAAPKPVPVAAAEPVAEPPAPATAPAAPVARPAVAMAPQPQPAPSGAAMSVKNQGLVTLETDWLRLTRAVTEARQRQDQIESQLFRADIQVSSESGGHGAQVTVIDPAFTPQRPQPPGRATLAAIFLLASFLLGLLIALARALFDERVLAASDLAGLGEVLVEVPRVTKRRIHAAT